MKKHKQIILTGISAMFIMLSLLAGFAPTVDAANTKKILCGDGKTWVEVDIDATLEDMQAACKDYGGYSANPPAAWDDTPYTSVECKDTNNPGDCAKTAFKFGTCDNSSTGIRCVVVEILTFLSIGVGLAVVAGIATGGIVYATSEGNPSKAQKGITIITNSVLGLVLYLLLYVILNFLVPGGVFA